MRQRARRKDRRLDRGPGRAAARKEDLAQGARARKGLPMKPHHAFAPLLALLAGCRSTYHDVRFVPAPLEVRVTAEGEPQAQARALLSVRGIRRAKDGQPAKVEMKLRVENLGASDVQLDADSLELYAADLERFGEPRVNPPPEPIPPGSGVVYGIEFPVPAGRKIDDYDLRGLNLKWDLRFGERAATTSVIFQRFVPAYEYPRTQVGLGLGFGFHD